jgi:hypothetical protein
MLAVGPGKPSPNNAFDNQMICCPGQAYSNPGVELPLRTEINVDGWKDLLLLL